MQIQTVGIIGAGQMGAGIAQVCAAAGLRVVMRDVSDAALQKGLATIAASLERAIKNGRCSEEKKQEIPATRGQDRQGADRGSELARLRGEPHINTDD